MKKYVILALLCVFLFVSGVSAIPQYWSVVWPGQTGYVILNPDGSGVGTLNDHKDLGFSWTMDADGNGVGTYMWVFTLKFKYNADTNTITCAREPNAKLVPIDYNPQQIPEPAAYQEY
jgi:hypothetical protein